MATKAKSHSAKRAPRKRLTTAQIMARSFDMGKDAARAEAAEAAADLLKTERARSDEARAVAYEQGYKSALNGANGESPSPRNAAPRNTPAPGNPVGASGTSVSDRPLDNAQKSIEEAISRVRDLAQQARQIADDALGANPMGTGSEAGPKVSGRGPQLVQATHSLHEELNTLAGELTRLYRL